MPYINPNDYGLTSPFKAAFASYLVNQSLQKEFESIKVWQAEHQGQKKDKLIPDDFNEDKHEAPPGATRKELKIGIIGGGIAGLYTAFILKFLKIDFEILEASERVGGRLLTHYFTDRPKPPTISHDYYDVGAMRFPDTPVMARTFKLFERMGLDKGKGLKEYHMAGENQPTRYNDITAILPLKDPILDDPFRVSTRNQGPVPDQSVKKPEEIIDDAYGRFRDKIKRAIEGRNKEEIKLAFDYLMRHDKFSLRDYLGTVEGQDWETIHWLETIGSATGWFDQAFTENVLESLAFEYISEDDDKEGEYWKKVCGKDDYEEMYWREELNVPSRRMMDKTWWYVDGGTEELVHRLKAELPANKIFLNHRVKKISFNEKAKKDSEKMSVLLNNGANDDDEVRTYSAIINTTTLAALQKMDLTKLDLPYGMKTAIRSLRYDSSTKVGIKFKRPWWVTDCKIEKAGLGKTDMPLRTCVYPSYTISCEEDKKNEAVLLASYSWGQDAERISAHVDGYETTDPEKEKQLKELMLYNLARLHTTTVPPEDSKNPKDVERARQLTEENFEQRLKTITDLYVTHHAYDWSKDPHSSGAFALFSPGQFSKMYPNLIRPACDSRFYIVGEAASAHHAWIVGALDSSVRALYILLTKFGLVEKGEERDQLTTEFGDVDELDYGKTNNLLKIGELKENQRKALGLEVGFGI